MCMLAAANHADLLPAAGYLTICTCDEVAYLRSRDIGRGSSTHAVMIVSISPILIVVTVSVAFKPARWMLLQIARRAEHV